MLRDKARVIKLTLPALTSTQTATLNLSELGIGSAEQESMQIVPLTSGNYTIAKSKISGKDEWKIVVTATGSVTNGSVAYVYAQAMAVLDQFTLTKDA